MQYTRYGSDYLSLSLAQCMMRLVTCRLSGSGPDSVHGWLTPSDDMVRCESCRQMIRARLLTFSLRQVHYVMHLCMVHGACAWCTCGTTLHPFHASTRGLLPSARPRHPFLRCQTNLNAVIPNTGSNGSVTSPISCKDLFLHVLIQGELFVSPCGGTGWPYSGQQRFPALCCLHYFLSSFQLQWFRRVLGYSSWQQGVLKLPDNWPIGPQSLYVVADPTPACPIPGR
jgi:hypothetical protein